MVFSTCESLVILENLRERFSLKKVRGTRVRDAIDGRHTKEADAKCNENESAAVGLEIQFKHQERGDLNPI